MSKDNASNNRGKEVVVKLWRTERENGQLKGIEIVAFKPKGVKSDPAKGFSGWLNVLRINESGKWEALGRGTEIRFHPGVDGGKIQIQEVARDKKSGRAAYYTIGSFDAIYKKEDGSPIVNKEGQLCEPFISGTLISQEDADRLEKMKAKWKMEAPKIGAKASDHSFMMECLPEYAEWVEERNRVYAEGNQMSFNIKVGEGILLDHEGLDVFNKARAEAAEKEAVDGGEKKIESNKKSEVSEAKNTVEVVEDKPVESRQKGKISPSDYDTYAAFMADGLRIVMDNLIQKGESQENIENRMRYVVKLQIEKRVDDLQKEFSAPNQIMSAIGSDLKEFTNDNGIREGKSEFPGVDMEYLTGLWHASNDRLRENDGLDAVITA